VDITPFKSDNINMTDQMVSQRCRIQARRISAQRSRFTLPDSTEIASNRQAQRTSPYPSFLVRNSPKWQRPPLKRNQLLIDFLTEECLRQDCYVKEPHTHQHAESKNITEEEDCSSPDVEAPPAGQVMLNSNINFARVDPEPNAGPTDRVMLSPKLAPRTLALSPTTREKLIPALQKLTLGNDSKVFSARSENPTDVLGALENGVTSGISGGGDWHTSLAIRPSLPAFDQGE